MGLKRSEKLEKRQKNWREYAKWLQEQSGFQNAIAEIKNSLQLPASSVQSSAVTQQEAQAIDQDRPYFWEYVLIGAIPPPQSKIFEQIALQSTEDELQSYPPYARYLMQQIRMVADTPPRAKQAFRKLLATLEASDMKRHIDLQAKAYPHIHELMAKLKIPHQWRDMLFNHIAYGQPFDPDLVDPCPLVVQYDEIAQGGRKHVLIEIFPDTTEEEWRLARQKAQDIHKHRFLSSYGTDGEFHYLKTHRIKSPEALIKKAKAFGWPDTYTQAQKLYSDQIINAAKDESKVLAKTRQARYEYNKRRQI